MKILDKLLNRETAMNNTEKVKVLFVCMGNICRSPTAHGVFENLVKSENLEKQLEIDSAGTHAFHVGNPPDRRAMETAEKRGIDLSYITARKVSDADYGYYDYILAMDSDNYSLLDQDCPSEYKIKLSLFLDFAPEHPLDEVPDPYYGGIKGFENVFDMIDAASRGLLDDIIKRHL